MRQAWAEGDAVLAESAFKALAVSWPDHSETLLLSAERLNRAGNTYAALQALQYGAEVHQADPRFHLETGRTYQRLQAWDLAAAELERSLARAFSPTAVSMLADCFVALADQASATNLWQRYLALYSSDAPLQAESAAWLYAQGDLPGALERWANALQLDPGNSSYYLEPAQALLRAEDNESAVGLLSAGITAAPSEQLFSELAFHHMNQGHSEAAVATWSRGLGLFPTSELLISGLVLAEINLGNHEQASAVVQRALTPTSSAQLFLVAGGLEAQYGTADRALEIYEQGLSAHPDDLALIGTVISLWGGQHEVEPVLNWLRDRRENHPETYPALLNQTFNWLRDTANRKVALQVSQELHNEDKADPLAAYWRGEFLRQVGDWDAALLATKEGILHSGDDTRLRKLELRILQQANRLEHAVPKAQALIELPGLDADAFYVAARACQAAHEVQLASEIAQRGLSMHPDSGNLLSLVASHLFNGGDIAGLIALLTDPAYQATESEYRDSTLGWAYLQEGSYVLAEAHLSLALHTPWTGPDRTTWQAKAIKYSWLGQAQYHRGRYAAARETLTRALALDAEDHECYVWLGLVLIELNDIAGAGTCLDAAMEKKKAGAVPSGWHYYANGRLALAQDNIEFAEACFLHAEAFAGDDPALKTVLREVRGL